MLEGRANGVCIWDGDLASGYVNRYSIMYYVVYLIVVTYALNCPCQFELS